MLTLLTGSTLSTVKVDVDGMERMALVYASEAPGPKPILFAFHGKSSSAENVAKEMDLQTLWPEAVVVYPEGDLGPSQPRGWHTKTSEDNQDIRFWDRLLPEIKKRFNGDGKRVYAIGHSNGAIFMYTLWAGRGSDLAGVGILEGYSHWESRFVPKPAFVSLGDKDEVIKPAQQTPSINLLFQSNESSQEGKPFGTYGTYYKGVQPVVLWRYPGGHMPSHDAFEAIVKFFKSVDTPK